MSRALLGLLVAAVAACSSTPSFVSSWRAPDAQPLEIKGARVAAVVMVSSEASRRVAEDKLAQEITARGGVGIPMYAIYPDTAPTNEPQARAALEKAGMLGVVVIRPVSADQEIVATPATYAQPTYRGYWDGYYGAGWGTPWGTAISASEIRTNTIVRVETLVYSLKQNKLVWAGQSRLANPSNIDRTIKQLSAAAALELQKQGLLPIG